VPEGSRRDAGPHPARAARARVLVELAVALVAVAVIVWAIRADVFWFESHAYGVRCIKEPRLFRVASAARIAGFAGGALLLLIVRPRLGRLIARRGPPSLAATGRVLLAVVLSLVATEVILRKPWKPAPPPPPEERYCPPIRPLPALTWGLVPSVDCTWKAGGREVAYSVNAEAQRVRSSRVPIDRARPTVVIAGESTALGLGIPYDETFIGLLEDRLGVQVVTLGVQGYGADQAYLRTEEVLPSYAHPIAIVTVFIPELVLRAETEDRTRLRVGEGGALALVPPSPVWLRDLRLRALWKDAIPYHADAAVADLRAIVRATAELARARGAYPLFLATNYDPPCLDVAGKRPWILRTVFDEQDVPHVDVDLPTSMQIDTYDKHPNSEGHRRLSAAVEGALRASRAL
jgi:hypothetical protein